MENPSTNTEDTRSRIIQAAIELFSERGYSGATTRAIAERAGVNEVTLFRHFGTKENLIQIIMQQFGGMAVAEEIASRLTGDYTQDLTIIGSAMMHVLTERNHAVRMAICEAGNFPEITQVVADSPRQIRQMLARYLDEKMQAGIIRQAHSEVLAQSFLGMFFSYAVLTGFLSDDLQPIPSKGEIVAEFVRIFAQGTLAQKE